MFKVRICKPKAEILSVRLMAFQLYVWIKQVWWEWESRPEPHKGAQTDPEKEKTKKLNLCPKIFQLLKKNINFI